ncbi:hypothetical protein AB0I77_30365 [Streptomyces sp. NPDC050619]|uniref:hypothetical protein n=1 Tax=Streptomyces sp. NPDC050619 TaxID=3157214 RepID=UPI00343450FB
MSSTAHSHPRSRAWLRVLVLLLVVLVPAIPAGESATPVATAEITEYDVLDTAPRPPARPAPRPLAPPDRTPRPAPAPAPRVPECHPFPAPPSPPYALHTLRSVVLRC